MAIRNWPMQRQIDLAFAVLALPLLAALVLLSWRAAASRMDAALENLSVVAQSASARSGLIVARTEAFLAALAERPGIATMGRGGCDPVFDTFAVQNREYANLLLVDAGGRVRCSAIPLPAAAQPKLGPMYLHEEAKRTGKLVIGKPEIGFISGRWVVPITYPLRDGGGSFIGHVGVSADLERFRPASIAVEPDMKVHLLLADANGLVMVSGEGAPLKVGDQVDKSILTGESASTPLQGWMHAASPVAGNHWHALALAEAGPVRAAMWRAGLSAGGLAMLLLIPGLWLARRIARGLAGPAKGMAESLAAAADGGPRPLALPGVAAEFATMAAAFDRVFSAMDTEKRRATQSEQDLNFILSSAGTVVYILSGDGQSLLYLSPGAEKLYGTSVRSLAQDPGMRHEHVLNEDRQSVAAMMQQVAERDQGMVEYRIRRDDGTIRWLREQCHVLRDAGGHPCRLSGVLADITDTRDLVETLLESESRFKALTALSADWYWEQDEELRFTRLSDSPARRLDLSIDANYIGKRRWELPTVGMSEADWAEHRATLARHAPFRGLEYGLILPDGRCIHLNISGEPVFDREGQFKGYRGVGRDITARKLAELELRKLSAAVEQSPVSIVITDIRGDIEYVNPCFCRSTGYAAEEVRGRNPRILKSGETHDEEYRQLWQAITRGEEWAGELHNRKKNGELFWEFVRIIPLVSGKGEVTNFMAVKEDITLRKELTAREQLRQEQMLHHARLAAMGEMAAALAHELNQPLAAIANFSGVVEHQLAVPQPNLAQAREVVDTIKGQALRAGDIVWRIREFSRKQESRREPTDINALVRDVVRLADIAAKSREVVYEYDLAPGLPKVTVDRVQIEQVMLNLIRNGVEAMEDAAGEKQLRLASRLTENGRAVQLSVSDFGCGLPDRIATDLFTPFFTTKPEGMGMGLSISRGIVEAHGGSLWASPNEEVGTIFHFTLPLQSGEA